MNSDWLAAYGSAFPTKEDCIGAIEFPLDVVLGRFVPYLTEGFALLDNLKSKPAMLAVGMKDRAISPAVQIADFKGIWPDRPVVKLTNAGHFSQEDAPDVLIALIQLFVQEKARDAPTRATNSLSSLRTHYRASSIERWEYAESPPHPDCIFDAIRPLPASGARLSLLAS